MNNFAVLSFLIKQIKTTVSKTIKKLIHHNTLNTNHIIVAITTIRTVYETINSNLMK